MVSAYFCSEGKKCTHTTIESLMQNWQTKNWEIIIFNISSNKGISNSDATKVQRQGQQRTAYFLALFWHFSSVRFAILWWKDIYCCPYSTDPSGNSITFDRDARSLNGIPRLKRQSKQIFTMEQYTPRERSKIVEIYIQQNKSIVTQRAFKKLKMWKVRLLRTPLI